MAMRRLCLALILGLGLLPGLAQALGLGSLTLRSHLYEPLDAEIELLSPGQLSANEILANLASHTDFDRAGVQRFYHLSLIRYQVTRNRAGRMVVRMTTEKPVTEPFLNFLVEIHWPSGKLLREYTILLDPVSIARTEPAPIRAPKAAPVAKAPEPPQPAPAPKPAVAPARTTSTAVASSPRKPSPEPVAGDTPPKKSPGAAPRTTRPDQYGPVKSNETLWTIAKRVRPDGVSMHQTMLAIQRANPEAFIRNNINLLRKGAVLRIPGADEIRDLDKQAAVQEVARQAETWRVKRDPAGGTADSKAEKEPDASHLRLVTPGAETQDKVSSAAGGAEKDGSEARAALETQLAVTKENLDKADRESGELRSRLGELEAQVDTLQRLLSLKDEQLAALQARLAESEDAAVEGTALPADAMDAMKDAMPGEGEMAPEEPLMTGDEAPAIDLLAEPEPVATPDLSLLEEPEVAEAPAPTPPPPPAPAPAPAPQPGLVDRILGNPMLLGGIGGGVLLALLGGVWAMRRKSAAAEEEDEGIADLLAEDADAPAMAPDIDLEIEDDASVAEEPPAIIEEPDLDLDLATEEPEDTGEAVPSLDELGLELTADIAGAGGAAAEEPEPAPAATEEPASTLSDLDAELDSMADFADEEDLGTGLEAEAPQAEPEPEPEPAPEPEPEPAAELEELDLGSLEEPPAEPAAEAVEELDLGSLDEVPEEPVAEAADELGLGDLELPAEEDLAESADELTLELDAEPEAGAEEPSLDELSAELDELSGAAAVSDEASGLDELDLTSDIGDELELDEDLDEVDAADEAGTKIDLARAYIDMGDMEGAREILDEVVVEGNEAQQAEAKALLEKL